MASEAKKTKTDKRNHPGRDGKWLKPQPKVKKVSFYTGSDRRKLNAVKED